MYNHTISFIDAKTCVLQLLYSPLKIENTEYYSKNTKNEETKAVGIKNKIA